MVDGVRFINAGSVGLPYEGDSDARWLWIEDGVPELRRTAYDAAGAGRRMRDACESLARLGQRVADRAGRGDRGDADVRGARSGRLGLRGGRGLSASVAGVGAGPPPDSASGAA